jgi:hypothetical protein
MAVIVVVALASACDAPPTSGPPADITGSDEPGSGWELRGEAELAVTFEPSPPRANRPVRVVARVGSAEGEIFRGEVFCRFPRPGAAQGEWVPLRWVGEEGEDVLLDAVLTLAEGEVEVQVRVDDRRFGTDGVQEVGGWRLRVE